MITLEDVIAGYGAGIARVALAYEANAAVREELTQEILLAVHLALPRLQNVEHLAPFVFRIAHNRCITHVARAVREKRDLASMPPPDECLVTPETELLVSEQNQRLASSLRRVALPYRQALSLFLEGLSHADIAEVLDISVSNVGVRINRGKAMLKVLLDE